MEAMRVAAIQHDIAWLDRETNFARLEPMIREAASNGAGLVVLSEMFSTGFAMGDEWAARLSEPRDGVSSRFLRDMASSFGTWVAGSCPEIAADMRLPANTLVVAGPDGTVHRYEKIHPFTYGGEDRYFRKGSAHLTVTIDGVRVSGFVCYDLRFADHFWWLAAIDRPLRCARELACRAGRALVHAAYRARDRKPGVRRWGQSCRIGWFAGLRRRLEDRRALW